MGTQHQHRHQHQLNSTHVVTPVFLIFVEKVYQSVEMSGFQGLGFLEKIHAGHTKHIKRGHARCQKEEDVATHLYLVGTKHLNCDNYKYSGD